MHTIVSVYNMLPKALSLNTIEPRGKQCSECSDCSECNRGSEKIKETDNWNSETLNGSGAVILVTQSR